MPPDLSLETGSCLSPSLICEMATVTVSVAWSLLQNMGARVTREHFLGWRPAGTLWLCVALCQRPTGVMVMVPHTGIFSP